MPAIFECQPDTHGARIAVNGVSITNACLTDGEVDGQIAYLKAVLDALAPEVKAEARRIAAEPLLARDEG